MSTWLTLPSNNVVPGQDTHLPDHDDIYSSLLTLWGAGLQGLINVAGPSFGADPTGTNDSTLAIENAISALPNGGTIYFPPGTYKISSALPPTNGIRFTGTSAFSTSIVSTASSIFTLQPATHLDRIEIDHLSLTCTGYDIFSGANIARCTVHDCILTQNSAGNSIWNAAGALLMEECVFERNIEYVYGNPRTVPAWPLAGGAINQCVWRDLVCWNEGGDNTQYFFDVYAATSGTQNESNWWRNIVFENPLGGMIRLRSTTRGGIDQCLAWDVAGTIQNSLIYLGDYSGNTSQPCHTNTIIHSGKMSTGYAFAAGAYDIQLDSTTIQTAIITPVPSATINIAGATGVSIVNPSTGMTVTGNATTVTTGAGAGTGATATAAAGSDNRSGSITWNTGTSPSTGDQVNVTFGNPFAVTPTIMLTPLNGATAGLDIAVESVTATGFSIYAGASPGASHTGYSVAWAAVSG
jgi:hypothetical protein